MSLVLDTGGLYAYYDRDDSWHDRMRHLIDGENGVLIVPAAVIPEADYLIGRELGTDARMALYDDIVEGVYHAVALSGGGYARVRELNATYQDLELGFVDAAVIATAEEINVLRIATTDRRDIGAVAGHLSLDLLP